MSKLLLPPLRQIALATLFLPHILFANLEGDKWHFHINDQKKIILSPDTSKKGHILIPLNEFLNKLDLEWNYNPKNFTYRIENKKEGLFANFEVFSNQVESSFGKITLVSSAQIIKQKTYVELDFSERVIRPLLTGLSPKIKSFKKYLASFPEQTQVLLDPGHGGGDFGAYTKYEEKLYKEKDFNLMVAKELAKELQKRKVSVSLSREGDYYLRLPERSEIIKKTKAKLFLSIHFNSSAKDSFSGFEIYVLSPNTRHTNIRQHVMAEHLLLDPQKNQHELKALSSLKTRWQIEASHKWAKSLESEFSKQLKSFGRSIKQGPFYLLFSSPSPALLLEFGFITSQKDRAFFLDSQKRLKLISSLAEKITSELKK